MVAAGSIGNSDVLNAPGSNVNAIDLQVTTVAAHSANGIYLREVTAGGNLIVGHVDAISVSVDVNQVIFNSTTSAVNETQTIAGRDDLTASSNGAVKVVVENGTLTVTEGDDNDGFGVQAIGSGSVLLEARGATSDVIVDVDADVGSGTGHITLRADDDIDLNADLSTGGSGTIFMIAASGTLDAIGPEVDGINVDGSMATVAGDILLTTSRDIRATANIG
jgi:hypothetical protein